jgi:hypothetical protein
MNIPKISIGKFILNTIFPFFEKSKAVALIKKDMLDVTDNLLAQLYDKVKPIFIKDDREGIFSQLEKNIEDEINQVSFAMVIEKNLGKDKLFFNEIKEIINRLEKYYHADIENYINEIEGDENKIFQGLNSKELYSKTIKNNINKVKGKNNYIVQG